MSFLQDDFKFIDLFAGIGGFHYAMQKISTKAECVFASEINPNAIKLYRLNFNQSSDNDITKVEPYDIEDFDVLCAGFPCQPFSKAGYQDGFKDTRGTLFFNIVKIIDGKIRTGHKPKLLILENVRNLASHDNYNTWNVIKKSLEDLGYNTTEKPLIVSPIDFDLPQLRERSIIVAIDKDIFDDKIDFQPTKVLKDKRKKTIFDILDNSLDSNNGLYGISDYQHKVLEVWETFMQIIGPQTLGFPIWSDEFFRDYDISDLPNWKQNFIQKNRLLYKKYKTQLDIWNKKYHVQDLIKTHRKFEWQAGKSIDSIYKGLIQFRPSGVRVKKPDYAPTLVAMAHTPIIGKYKRFITPIEALKLQSFPDSFKYDEVGNDIYRLLGNAVNVDVIYEVSNQFIQYINKRLEGKSV